MTDATTIAAAAPPAPDSPHPVRGPAHPVYVAAPAPTDGLAIASFVLGLLGFGLIPVILGHVALRRIARSGAGGSGFAIVGLVLGYLTLAAVVVALIVAAIATIWAVTA